MKLFAKITRRVVAQGQSVLEYAILLAIVSAAFITMSVYVRRAVQGKLYRIDERVVAKNNASVSTPVAQPTV